MKITYELFTIANDLNLTHGDMSNKKLAAQMKVDVSTAKKLNTLLNAASNIRRSSREDFETFINRQIKELGLND